MEEVNKEGGPRYESRWSRDLHEVCEKEVGRQWFSKNIL